MRWYARDPWRVARQAAVDLVVVIWCWWWWSAGRWVDALIRSLSESPTRSEQLTRDLAGRITEAGMHAGGVPFVGGRLQESFDGIADSVGSLADSVQDLTGTIDRVATAAGWVTFALPVVIALAIWLPLRIGFVLRARATALVATRPHGDDLLALRALTTAPLRVLDRLEGDVAAGWRAGDAATLTALSELEQVRAGIRRPAGAPPNR